MNDRFKFRVWSTKHNCYQEYCSFDLTMEGRLIDGAGNTENNGREDLIIEQCTGLKDKNGNLIYEGDHIQFVQKRGYYTDKGDVCTIEFGTFRFCGFGWRSRPEYTVDFALTESAAKKCVIVGNIHEQKDKQ